jgi:hypothetical protein
VFIVRSQDVRDDVDHSDQILSGHAGQRPVAVHDRIRRWGADSPFEKGEERAQYRFR